MSFPQQMSFGISIRPHWIMRWRTGSNPERPACPMPVHMWSLPTRRIAAIRTRLRYAPCADWSALTQEHSRALVKALRDHFLGGGDLEITAKQLANESNASEGDATKLLDRVAGMGALRIVIRSICPCADRTPLTEDDIASGVCPRCNKAFEADLHNKISSNPSPQPRITLYITINYLDTF